MTAARKLPPPAPSRDLLVQKLLASPVESATEEERQAIETAMRMPVVDGVVVTALSSMGVGASWQRAMASKSKSA